MYVVYMYTCIYHTYSTYDFSLPAFTETLANDVLSFNLPETISTLQQISIAFMTAGETDLATDTDSIITQLQDVQNNQIPAINMSVQLLESQVNDLSTHIDTVVVSPLCFICTIQLYNVCTLLHALG